MKRILLLALMIMLGACSNSSRFDPTTTHKLTLSIRLVPQALLGMDGSQISSTKSAVVQLNETVEFWGFVQQDSVLQTLTASEALVNNTFFTIRNDTISTDKYRTSFSQAGIDTVVYHAIDYMEDTIVDTLILYVNTPLQLTVKAPSYGLLNVQVGAGQKIPFAWTLTGVDAWEAPQVALYLARDSSQLENIAPTYVTSESSLNLDASALCPSDSVCRYWWRMIASVSSEMGDSPANHDTSRVFFFQTSQSGSLLAKAQIFIQEVSAHVGKGIWVKSHNVALGTEVTWSVDTLLGQATSPSLSPGTWTVKCGDSLHPEFFPESLSVDLMPGEFRNIGDLIQLTDKIAPQAWLLYHVDPEYNRTKDSLVFQLYDGGAGIDSTSITATWTNAYTPIIRETQVIFRYDSLTAKDTTLLVTAKDKAGNSNQNCHWSLIYAGVDTVWVRGPFCTASSSDTLVSKAVK